jgi:hypothetical protein
MVCGDAADHFSFAQLKVTLGLSMVSNIRQCYSPTAERVMTSWPFRTICGLGALGCVVGFYLLKGASQKATVIFARCCQSSSINETLCPYNSSEISIESLCDSEANKESLLSLAALGSMVLAASLAITAIAIRKCCKKCREIEPSVGSTRSLPQRSYTRVMFQYGTSPEDEGL